MKGGTNMTKYVGPGSRGLGKRRETLHVRNLDEQVRRTIKKGASADERIRRYRWLEQVEGFDEIQTPSGWVSLASEINRLKGAVS